MKTGENESKVLGMEDMKRAEAILRSSVAPSEIRLELYKLFREAGYYEIVIPKIGNDLLGMEEFSDIRSLLENPKSIQAIKSKDVASLMAMGIPEKFANSTIEQYTDMLTSANKETRNDFRSLIQKKHPELTGSALERQVSAYIEASGEISALEFMKQGLLDVRISSNPNLRVNKTINLYGDMV
jgi:hypothetical protein